MQESPVLHFSRLLGVGFFCPIQLRSLPEGHALFGQPIATIRGLVSWECADREFSWHLHKGVNVEERKLESEPTPVEVNNKNSIDFSGGRKVVGLLCLLPWGEIVVPLP